MNKDTLKTNSTDATFRMSAHDFTEWGVSEVAYIKKIEFQGKPVFAVYAANGRQLAVTETENVAYGLLFQNDLEPVNLH